MKALEALKTPGLEDFWVGVRRQLDRGTERRPITIKRPPLDRESERALQTLLGDAYRSRISLDALERELVVRQIGADLDDAVTRLGHPPSAAAIARHGDTVRRREARQALEAAVASWSYPWSQQWARELVASGNVGGLDAAEVTRLVSGVEKLVRLAKRPIGSNHRTDIAALLFGDSHSLDPGRRLTNWAERALRHVVGDIDGQQLVGRELWEAAGFQTDRVSAPALVWGLNAAGSSPAAELTRQAYRLGVPVHLSSLVLDVERGPFEIVGDTEVLMVENPRVVEYAAQHRLDRPLIAANGNPSAAVMLLVQRIQFNGGTVRYHGDFDAAGLAICGRMAATGIEPWQMSNDDYQAAVTLADQRDVQLDRDERLAARTDWDPQLSATFNTHRQIIHQEFLLGTDLLF